MSMDLSQLSLKELKDLQTRIAKEVSGFQDRKKREALIALEEKARELGFSMSELTGAAKIRKRSPAVAKYANPANDSETWSGRGRKPLWLVAALKSGKRPEDMMI
jgi:DNA-binding protein H-NS